MRLLQDLRAITDEVAGCPRRGLWAAPAVVCLAMAGLPSLGADPPAVSERKPDWPGLDSLLWSGDYEKAAAAADDIATALKPKRRDTDFLAESIGFFRALLRRGFAELRLGRLDDAAATLEQARRIPRDAEFKRLLGIETRSMNAKAVTLLVSLNINFVELLDLQMSILVERLRLASLGRDPQAPPSDDTEAKLRTQVGDWLDDLDKLGKTAREARKSLAESIETAGSSMLASPYNQALVGGFREAMIAGGRSLALSRLPFGDPRDAAAPPLPKEQSPPGAAGPEWLETARRELAAATTALDEAVAAAAPKGVAALKPQQTIEMLLLREELLVLEGEVLLSSDDAAGSRERFTKAMELVRQIATLRKLTNAESHPDLFPPLVRCAEAMLREARRDTEGGDPTRGRQALVEASKLLAQAEGLPFPKQHPLRASLPGLQARVEEGLSQVGELIPGADAATAAARRLRRSLEGAPVSSDVVSP
jgi:hypothetical protein